MVAAQYGRADIADVLLNHYDIDVDVRNVPHERGWRAEDFATHYGHHGIAQSIRTCTAGRAKRKILAAMRIQRFLRDTTCNPIYAAARRSLERLATS